jgi:hypothetical protein
MITADMTRQYNGTSYHKLGDGSEGSNGKIEVG